jgi:DHA1 family tetracycline resistance protein-like MFS transporter
MELGLGLTAIGFLMIASLVLFKPGLLTNVYLYASVIVLIIGDGLFEPAYSAALSNMVDNKRQGQIQGANQSMQSLSRALGPIAAAGLYVLAPSYPYIAGAIVFVVTLVLLARFRAVKVA